MARDRPDELRGSSSSTRRIVRIAWVSAPSGDDNVGPDAIEDLLAADRTVALLDEQQKKIEIAGNERYLVLLAQHPLRRREQEPAEAIPHREMLLVIRRGSPAATRVTAGAVDLTHI